MLTALLSELTMLLLIVCKAPAACRKMSREPDTLESQGSGMGTFYPLFIVDDNMPPPQSRELNVIRNDEDNQFDYLIIVIFDSNFGVKEAYMLPHDTIKPYAKYSKHQNGYLLVAKGAVLVDHRTKNIADLLR